MIRHTRKSSTRGRRALDVVLATSCSVALLQCACSDRTVQPDRKAGVTDGLIEATEAGRVQQFLEQQDVGVNELVSVHPGPLFHMSPVQHETYDVTPLHVAALLGRIEAVQWLLCSGARTSIPAEPSGACAIHWAAIGGDPSVVSALIEAGADVDAQSRDGATPLMFASQYSRVECVRLLVAAGARVNATSTKGWTSLHGAAIGGNAEIVAYLLENGADATRADGSGWLPVHCSASRGHRDATEALGKLSDPCRKTVRGLTAIEAALSGGHLQLAQDLAETLNCHERR